MGPLQMVIFYAPSPEVIKAYFSSSQSQFTLSRFTVFAYLENIDAGCWSTSPPWKVVCWLRAVNWALQYFTIPIEGLVLLLVESTC